MAYGKYKGIGAALEQGYTWRLKHIKTKKLDYSRDGRFMYFIHVSHRTGIQDYFTFPTIMVGGNRTMPEGEGAQVTGRPSHVGEAASFRWT